MSTNNPKSELTSTVIFITPKIAKEWLEDQINPRKFIPSNLRHFEQELITGQFETTHQGLLFDKQGRLRDGQHRCQAIVNTGIGAWMQCTFGATEEMCKKVDNGRVRQLHVRLNSPRRLVEAARFIGDTISTGGRKGMSDGDVEQMCGIISNANTLLEEASSDKVKVISTAPFRAAAIYYIMAGQHKDYVLGLYPMLVAQRSEEFPKIGHSLYRRITKDEFPKLQVDMLSLALSVFDSERSNSERVNPHPAALIEFRAFFRRLVANAKQ